MRLTATLKSVNLYALGAVMALTPLVVGAQDRPVPDTYKAVTAHMSPAGVELKIDVLRWSTDEQRGAVVEAISRDEGVAAALRDLPSLGVVWRSGSAVGHSIKYAHRETMADGSEHITLVTDKPVGATSFNPWTADDTGEATSLEFSVLEFTTGGSGTMSLGAEVLVDAATETIALERAARPALLTNVRKEPRPYWAD